MGKQRQQVLTPDRRVVEAVAARVAVRQIPAATSITLAASITRGTHRNPFMHDAMKQWQSFVQIVESVLEQIKTRFRCSFAANLKSIESLNGPVSIYNQIVRSTITDQIAPRFATENCSYDVFEASNFHSRIIFINPLIEDRNEIVSHWSLAVAPVELLLHIMSGIRKEEVHTRNAK